MRAGLPLYAATLLTVLALAAPVLADETPKRGGVLTYMIPADAPPSFDGHRENTFATIHAVAPFYSVLVRADPANPADTTRFVCDVCTEIPAPTDDGRSVVIEPSRSADHTDEGCSAQRY